MQCTKIRIALFFFLIALFTGCKKKKLGEECKTKTDCEKGSTCLTVEGKSACTKRCSKDADCPNEFVCTKLKVRMGTASTAVPQTYCLEKKFLARADKKSKDRANAKVMQDYKKLKKTKGVKLSKVQLSALKNFVKKHKIAYKSEKVVYLTLAYLSSYNSVWTSSLEKALTKENRLWKKKLRILFLPLPAEKTRANYALLLGQEILHKKGMEEYWRFHKKLVKNWATSDRLRTAIRLGKMFGYTASQVRSLRKTRPSPPILRIW